MKRKITVFILVVVLIMSVVCFSACDSQKSDIICVVTAPGIQIEANIDSQRVLLKISDVELILKDNLESKFCGRFLLSAFQGAQSLTNVSVAFRQAGTKVLIDIVDTNANKTEHIQISLSNIWNYLQGYVAHIVPSDKPTIHSNLLILLEESFAPIIDVFDKEIENTKNKFQSLWIKALFANTSQNKSQYTFSVSKAKELNADLYQLPLKTVINQYFGNGKDDLIDQFYEKITEQLDKPMGKSLKNWERKGLTKEMLAKALDSIAKLLTQSQVNSWGQLFGKYTTLDYLNSPEFSQATLRELIGNLGLSISDEDIATVIDQLDSTLYQLIFGVDIDQQITAHDSINQLIDEIDTCLDLSVDIKGNKIQMVDVDLSQDDVELNVSIGGNSQLVTMDIDSKVSIDYGKKTTSNFNYDKIGEGWAQFVVSGANILIANKLIHTISTYSATTITKSPIVGYIAEKDVYVDGNITKEKHSSLNTMIGCRVQRINDNTLFVTGWFPAVVNEVTRFVGYYRPTDSVDSTYINYNAPFNDYQEIQTYSAYINTQTNETTLTPE